MPPQNSEQYHVPFGNHANFVNLSSVAAIKIQQFSQNSSSTCGIFATSRSSRSAPVCVHTRQGEGRSSRPPKAALEPSYIRPRIPVPRIACFGQNKKLLTKYMTPRNDFLHIYNMRVLPWVVCVFSLGYSSAPE